MCGIVGIYNYGRVDAVEQSLLKRMNNLIAHRGPDDEGYFVQGKVGLAMRRLSIIDLSSGHQPIANDDGTIQIVFNGEIYNFQSLREELITKGHKFKTQSDTEAILRLYEEMGPDCVKRLRGMFAFAIWDARKNRLMLARDRVGKKPLVYSNSNGQLAWASEIRPLLEVPGISKEVDPQAIDLYLGLQYIPSPLTAFKAIRKLPPAHVMIQENGTTRIERYWELPLNSFQSDVTFEEAKTGIREKLTEATRLRMISDVPLGGFLSGGMDSSVVVGLMSGLSSRPVKTFSIGFEEDEFSEFAHARAVARHFGTDHTEFVVKPEMAEVLPKLARHYGEPFGDSSALPTYYLARETRRHVTVALTGDGGDENFAGYKRYMLMNAFMTMRRLLGRSSPESWAQVYLRLIGIFQEQEKSRMYSEGMKRKVMPNASRDYLGAFWKSASSQDGVNRMLSVDWHSYLPECLMVKADIATMANSLEARSPLLDHELIEYVFRLRGSWKLKGFRGTKWIFKETFRHDLPSSISRRSKMGFGIPLGSWFRGKLSHYWRDHVLSPAALARGYFREEFLRKLFDEHMSGRRDHGYRMWNLLMLELWHENCLPGGSIA